MKYYENFHRNETEETPRKQPPNPALREGNLMASLSLLMGIAAFYSAFIAPAPMSSDYPFFALPIFFGVGGITASILSRKKTTKRGSAILGFIFGLISLTIGIMAFFSIVLLLSMIKDPEYAPMINQMLHQMPLP